MLEQADIFDVVIVGGGAAGFSAGLYSARYLLKTCVVRGAEPGGETARAATIENYPGIVAIDGFELMATMEEQNKKLGVEILDGEVASIKKEQSCFVITLTEGETLAAKSIILAMGSKRRKLGLVREQELTGRGVSYCATCDAPLYRGKVVGIVGGGDSAAKGAILASPYAEKVYVLVRTDALNAEPANIALLKQQKNIEILYNTEVKELVGSDRLEKIILSKPYNGSVELPLGGLFVEIGAVANSALARELGVALDSQGWVEVDPMMRTNVEGVFAAGDLVNETGAFKQVIVAAAQGAIAVTSAKQYLEGHVVGKKE